MPARSRLAVRQARPGAFGAGAPDTTRLGGPALLVAFSLAAVGAGTARALTTTYLPVLLERIDDAPTLIGAVMTVNAVAGLVVPLAVGRWSDRRRASGLGRPPSVHGRRDVGRRGGAARGGARQLREDDRFFFALYRLGAVRDRVRAESLAAKYPNGRLPDGRRIVHIGLAA